MSFVEVLRQLFARPAGKSHETSVDDESSSVDEMMELLQPPEDLLDGEAWDTYWENHLKFGFGPPMFDMMFDDADLVRAMRAAELATVLCVGNGMSMEPRALAAAGFHVTALDVAPRVTSFARRAPLDDQYVANLIGDGEQRPGGEVDFVTGNILDGSVCPGPFDIVIERRTAQNYAAKDMMGDFLVAAASRLAKKGIFVSHCHDGAWRPGRDPSHLPGDWFKEQGWLIWQGEGADTLDRQVAWLIRSTG